jgi:hypothetical protein
MTEFALEGIATRFGEIIDSGNELLFLKPGSLTLADEVRLLIDHDKGNGLASTDDLLEVHVGEKLLAFRFHIPYSRAEEFKDQADCFETYLPVSMGMTITESETMTIDGVQVKVISAATLNEVSIISSEPAVKTSYARVVSADTCEGLADVSDRFELIGRFINIHRKASAPDNGGVVRYANATSASDIAANRFTKALAALL